MPEHGLTYRAMEPGAVGPITLDQKKRTVEAVGATEAPVWVFDYERYERIREVLLMSGCRMPTSKRLPLLDSHSRYDTSRVVGSFRDLRIEADELVGTAVFSSVPEVESTWTKVREGHLTDFSLGYRVEKAVWIPKGETQTINGRTFEGPVRVATEWIPGELSVVPIGADEFAKARAQARSVRDITEDKSGDMNMNDKKLKKNVEDQDGQEVARAAAPAMPAEGGGSPPSPQQTPTQVVDHPLPVDEDQVREDATRAERGRVQEIQAMCQRFDCADLAGGFISGNATVDQVREKIMERMMARPQEPTPYRGPVYVLEDERDKFRAAAEDAILIRADFGPKNQAPGAEELAGYSLRELARHSLRIAGRPTGGNPMEMVGRALTTSDFPYILANVANKSLFAGFDDAEETWQQWCATGSVSDFKTHYSPRISEFSGLEEIPEETEYKYGKRTEAQESYQIATYGKMLVISRQTIINDDLGAITRNSAGMGEAASRLVGDVAYAVLTANAAMGDGVALFHNATHGNLAAGGDVGAPAIATLAAAILAMKSQKDLQGLRRLNIRPRFFLAPVALEGVSEVFFRSERFSDSDTVATDSSLASTRVNPYAGSYFSRVYEPRLDDDSAAAWYLAGAKGKTVTLFFLNGQQRPYMETKQGWSVDGVEYKIRIDCGAKALDWKALYKNPGT